MDIVNQMLILKSILENPLTTLLVAILAGSSLVTVVLVIIRSAQKARALREDFILGAAIARDSTRNQRYEPLGREVCKLVSRRDINTSRRRTTREQKGKSILTTPKGDSNAK